MLVYNLLFFIYFLIDIDTYTMSDIGKECFSIFQFLIEYSKVDYILTKKIDFMSYCNIMNDLLNDNTLDINITINLLHFIKLFWTINEKYQTILISHFINKNGMNNLVNLIYNSNVIISSETTKLLLLMISSNNDIYNSVINKYFRIYIVIFILIESSSNSMSVSSSISSTSSITQQQQQSSVFINKLIEILQTV